MKALVVGDASVEGLEIERVSVEEAAARLRQQPYEVVIANPALLRQLAAVDADAQRRLEEEHREFIERAADGVFTHRRDLSVTYVNPAMVAFLGYQSPAELLGRPVLDLVHPDDRSVVRERIKGVFESRQP